MATVSPWFQTAQLLAKIRKRVTVRKNAPQTQVSRHSPSGRQLESQTKSPELNQS